MAPSKHKEHGTPPGIRHLQVYPRSTRMLAFGKMHKQEGGALWRGVMMIFFWKSGKLTRALQAEAVAALKGLQRWARSIILEVDTAVLGTDLETEAMDGSPNGVLFRQIRSFLALHFDYFCISVCPRTGTGYQTLASQGAHAMMQWPDSLFMSQAPEFVLQLQLVSGDMPRASVFLLYIYTEKRTSRRTLNTQNVSGPVPSHCCYPRNLVNEDIIPALH